MSETACAAHDGHRVLVVDDNRPVREALVTLLEGRGFAARGVANGREALEALRAGFDACLILLDLVIPIMDGWKFRKLQQQDAKLAAIPVVVLATLSDATKAAAKMGALAGFAKPLEELEPLVQLVAAHCPHGPAKGVGSRVAQRAAQVRAAEILSANRST
jgi:CheY-like chemotaxis protein